VRSLSGKHSKRIDSPKEFCPYCENEATCIGDESLDYCTECELILEGQELLRQCKYCEEKKPPSEFHKANQTGARRTDCKKCQSYRESKRKRDHGDPLVNDMMRVWR
jgi:hypothetical protein